MRNTHGRIRSTRVVYALAGLLLLSGCAGGNGSSADSVASEWKGTITTEGGVTTVVNESGSVWGGAATLVEEASIGVEAGADEYMFGFIESVWATEDRIYVVDSQVPAVRVYDHDGNHLEDLGRPGEGPGEYRDPGRLVVGPDGRVFLMAFRGAKLVVYGSEGSHLETRPTEDVVDWPFVVSGEGVAWLPIGDHVPSSSGRRYGIQGHGPDGPDGPRWYVDAGDFERPMLTVRGRELPVPLSPGLEWTPAAPATMVVGTGDRYRFETQREGRTVRVVERRVEPTPVAPDRRAWTRRLTVVRYRDMEPGWQWNGPQIPEHLPAFTGFLAAASGELWVRRPIPARRLPDCVEDPLAAGAAAARSSPCWEARRTLDAFDADGLYLGEVDLPPEARGSFADLFVRGRLVVAAVTDDAGTRMVKRYRLEPPERSPR